MEWKRLEERLDRGLCIGVLYTVLVSALFALSTSFYVVHISAFLRCLCLRLLLSVAFLVMFRGMSFFAPCYYRE